MGTARTLFARDKAISLTPRPAAMHKALNHRLNPLRSAPNLLTILRICIAPFLVAAILDEHYLLSFSLFAAAGLTDALDGTLARMLKQRSMLGHYLDPVADKLLLSALFLVLLHKGLMPVTVTVLVIGRDVGILMVAAILYAAVGRREFQPSIFGKANTLAQIGAVAAVLLGLAPDGHASGQWSRRQVENDPGGRGVGLEPPPSRESFLLSLGIVREIFRSSRVFNLHIAKLFGIEDLATFQALDVLGVVVPGNDPDLGVSAGGCHRSQGLMNLQPSRAAMPCPGECVANVPRRGEKRRLPPRRRRPVARDPGPEGAGSGDSHSGMATVALSARL